MPDARTVRRLVEAALAARRKAYCPYSRYAVGAAALVSSGEIFTGCNVENASLGLSLCAERVAIFNAVASGRARIAAICVAARSPRPCGACRQVMSEFMRPTGALYLVAVGASARRSRRKQRVTRTTISRLLPEAFDGKVLL